MTDRGLILAGVCGWPIHHSLSPLMHSYWLKEMNISGAYVHFAVRPDEAVEAFQSLKRTSIAGVNVTLPLKVKAFEAADDSTPDARKLGVANCLYKRRGKLIAHNTDLEGFAAPLLSAFGAQKIANSSALVIGAGGAAQAVIGALLSLNCPEIRLTSRTDSKSEALSKSVNVPSLYTVPWAAREDALGKSGLIINASAGGMTGKPALDFDLSQALPGAFIYDLIYTPRTTPLLKQAKKLGLPYLGGLEMLIAQARPSFKLFYGVRPPDNLDPTDVLLEALEGRA